MRDLLVEAKEMVSWLHWPSGLGPDKYRENPSGYPELAAAASTWLSQHPREAVEAIQAVGMGKYDAELVELLAARRWRTPVSPCWHTSWWI